MVEALIVLAVVAIVAALGAPSMSELLARDRVATTALAVLHMIGAARAEAIRRGAPVTICRALAADSPSPRCATDGRDWSDGWLLVAGDGSSAAAPLRRYRNDPRLASVILSSPVGWKLTLTGSGLPVGSFAGGSFRVCPAGRPDLGRSVVVSRGARLRVVEGTCAG